MTQLKSRVIFVFSCRWKPCGRRESKILLNPCHFVTSPFRGTPTTPYGRVGRPRCFNFLRKSRWRGCRGAEAPWVPFPFMWVIVPWTFSNRKMAKGFWKTLKYSVIACTLADFQVFFDQGMKLICGSGSELVLGSKFEDVVDRFAEQGRDLKGKYGGWMDFTFLDSSDCLSADFQSIS